MTLQYNEVTPKKYIEKDGEPYEVLSSHVFRKQQRKPVNQTKLKNLITGKVIEHSFHQSDKVEEADIEKSEAQYLYNNKGSWWFCSPNDPKDRYSIDDSLVQSIGQYMSEKVIVELLSWNEKIIGVSLPIKVQLRVVEAPPAERGNTAQGGSKKIRLETGAEINAPLFIAEGDIVEINTETGEYTGRVSS